MPQLMNAAAGTRGERKSADSDRHSDSKPSTGTRSIPSSPHGTPKASHRQASFSHHNVPPIASTVAAAIAALGGTAPAHEGPQTSFAFQPGTSYAGASAAGRALIRF